MRKSVIMRHPMMNLVSRKGSSLIRSGLTKKCKSCGKKLLMGMNLATENLLTKSIMRKEDSLLILLKSSEILVLSLEQYLRTPNSKTRSNIKRESRQSSVLCIIQFQQSMMRSTLSITMPTSVKLSHLTRPNMMRSSSSQLSPWSLSKMTVQSHRSSKALRSHPQNLKGP